MKGQAVDTYQTLNDVLVNLFRDIMDIEQKAIITEEYKDLTNNDMHVIEAIGIGEAKNMPAIARVLSVTVGTLTIAMNSLVKKGYVTRQRGTADRREVYISLSEKGRAAYEHHADQDSDKAEPMVSKLERRLKEDVFGDEEISYVLYRGCDGDFTGSMYTYGGSRD